MESRWFMKVYLYFDGFQKDFGMSILEHISEAEWVRNEKELCSCDFSKMPTVLILASQPSDAMSEALKGYEWSFILSRKGIRFNSEQLYHYETLESLNQELESALKMYTSTLQETYRKMYEFLIPSVGVSKKDKLPSLNGLYVLSGSPDLFASMVKYYASRKNAQKILAIDGNLLKPSFDRIFSMHNIYTKVESHLKGIDNTGFNILYDAVLKKVPLSPILKKITHYHHLGFDYLLGNYNVYNYEHYHDETLCLLLKLVQQSYDVVFVNIDTFVSDSFSLLCYHESKKNIFVSEDTSENLRYIQNMMDLIAVRQRIDKGKNLVVVKKSKIRLKCFDTKYKMIFGKQFTGTYVKESDLLDILCKRLGA